MTDSIELPPIERLEAVHLEPGDVLVAHLSGRNSPEVHARAREAMGSYFPRNRVLVVDESVDVEIMRPGAVDAA